MELRGLFSTLCALGFPDDTDWILAEPSNNNNLAASRQLFFRNLADFSTIARFAPYRLLSIRLR
jgi:hypothetical protein